MNRRELLLTSAAAVAVTALPITPLAVPVLQDTITPPLLSFIVGSDGEADWQWFKATDKADAIAQFISEHCGADQCEVDAANPPEDCDCEYCDFIMSHGVDASRVKRWDDRTYQNAPTPADWLKAGFSYRCNCGADYSVTLGDGGFICPDGINVECEDCHDKRKRDEQHRIECAELDAHEPAAGCARSGKLVTGASP